MKTYITILALIMIAAVGCTTQSKLPATGKGDTATSANDTVRIANEELEYEVIIIDGGFNSWLASRARPRGYYEQSYLETKNRLWIMEWNSRVLQPQRYGGLYEMRIDYDPFIDYGYEVNYLIYNYLIYFQQTNRQRLGGIVPQF
jgi:hypothetical protein